MNELLNKGDIRQLKKRDAIQHIMPGARFERMLTYAMYTGKYEEHTKVVEQAIKELVRLKIKPDALLTWC